MLFAHGDIFLSVIEGIFKRIDAKLFGKDARIHWHYTSKSHVANLTIKNNSHKKITILCDKQPTISI
jgi:hypothetical protein